MAWYNWLIVIIPFVFVIGMAFYSRRYIRDVVDYLSAGRVCGRYVIAVAGLESALGLITLVACPSGNISNAATAVLSEFSLLSCVPSPK